MTQKKYLLYISQNYSFAVLRPIQKAILARGDDVVWFVDGNQVTLGYFKPEEKRLISITEVNAYKPTAVFVPGNYVPSFIEGLKVAVFHGFNVEKRNNARGHFNIRGCFDLYCTQGPNTTEPFQALAESYQYFSVKETGWSAIDPLFDVKNAEKISQTQLGNVQLSKTKPTILMCSTFSQQLTCAPELFETVKKLSSTGRWHWLVQFHPKMDKETVQKYKSIQGDYLTFIETDNVIPLLQQADVMLCDTSSVITMFLLLNKPVVTFKNSAPKACLIDIDDKHKLEKSIEFALEKPATLMAEIAHFIQQTHPYSDGNSAERVLDAVNERLSGINVPKKSKPFAFIRELKKRKKLNYWKFW